MNRRSMVLSTAAALSAGCIGRADAADTVRCGAIPIDSDGVPFFAQSFGYFQRNGLNVEIQPMTTGDAAAAAILAGSLEFGSINTVSLAIAHERGLPLKVIAGGQIYLSTAPTTQMIVLKDSPVNSAVDLSGKTVAVNVLRGVAHVSAQAWIDHNGGDSKAVKFTEMPFQVMGDAITAKRVDAAVSAEPGLTFAKHSNARVLASVYDGIAKTWMVDMYVGTEPWIRAHADEVRRIRTAFREAAIWANANPAKTEARLAEFAKMPLEAVKQVTRCRYAESLDPALIQPVIDVSAKYGVIPKTFPVSELIVRS